MQLSKIFVPILITEGGIVIYFNEMQSLNAKLPIDATDEMQSLMEVIEEGIEIDFNEKQFLNEKHGIQIIPTSVVFVQLFRIL